MAMILIYITTQTREQAKDIAKHLIKKDLIACGNIFSIDSIYRWKDKIEDEPEFVLVAKTTEENYNNVKSEVKKMHTYDIPCIIKIPVTANQKYFEWLNKEVSQSK